jgi:hypothetical protein
MAAPGGGPAGGVRVITVAPGAPGAGGRGGDVVPGDRRVVYECNFAVDSAVAEEFLAYLRAHVEEICRLENGALFDRATLCIAENEGDPHEDEAVVAAQGAAAAAATADGKPDGAAAAAADDDEIPPPPPPSSGKLHVCARYRARSRFRLQEYFDRAGERLRRDMQTKWGGRFTVQRRILAVHHIVEN